MKDAEVGNNLVVALKYGPARERSIAGLKRVSKPGLRVYAKKDNLPRVLGGQGIAYQGHLAGDHEREGWNTAEVIARGDTVTHVLNGRVVVFHRPHPRKEAGKATVEAVRDFLIAAGILP